MDSWTLQGESYSFLRSAPRNFSLCHRAGTPNHVEIFDIINVPTQRSAISETTCLCDIFGDDCESSSLSSSPAVGPFVSLQRDVEGTAAASPVADELNDSSGSYHTAQGSSEGEEGFEDSRERLCSPPFLNASAERKQSESEGLKTGNPDIFKETSNNFEPKSKSDIPELKRASVLSEGFNSGERTPSPGYNSPHTLSSEGRVSSLSSSSLDKTRSPSSPCTRRADSETEQRDTSPTFKGSFNSLSRQPSTPSTSPESRTCVHPSSPHSVNSSPAFTVAQVSPEAKSYLSSSPPPAFENLSLDFTGAAFESRAIQLSPAPSPTPLPPELDNRPDTASTHRSSPFAELRGRVSLPDLFSRDSTPDLENITCTPELISEHSPTGRHSLTTPENIQLSPEPLSSVSSPAPRYTPPSPAVSVATSPELVESSLSPVLRNKTPSPGLLGAASPCTTETRTRSPRIGLIPTPSELRSYSFPHSPEARSSCSPRGAAPSPEIRVTGSSPEVSRRGQTSEAESTSPLSLLGNHFDSFSTRSPTSSPHITGISYTVVQPEDRSTPPFPELSHLSTPEPKRTPEGSSPTPSRDSSQGCFSESPGASQNSQHLSLSASCVLQSGITSSHPSGYKTPSPQPQHLTPSPEPTHKIPLSENGQSPSPHRGGDPSHVGPVPEQSYHQHSPTTVSTEHNLLYTQPNLRNSETERDTLAVDIPDIQYPTKVEGDVPPSERNRQSVTGEIKLSSPVQAVRSPASTSPIVSEVRSGSPLKNQNPVRGEASATEAKETSHLLSSSEKKQDTDTTHFQELMYKKNSFDCRNRSPDSTVLKAGNTDTSPVNRAISSSPVHGLETLQPCSVTSESSSLSKSSCTPRHPRRQLSTHARNDNRETLHYVNKRRTPSPPLTRFTPVHIIAPEKPYRQWQNRSQGCSQVVAFSPSGHLKKDVTNRESPRAPGDSNSKDHWVRLERQLEMEREIQLEDQGEVRRDKEIDIEKKWEERVLEKGGGCQGDTSYMGEQVELSFNARNRKGPASRSNAPTSRETRQGLPTAHSYAESLPATRQLQQQQRLLRLASQQDTRVGGPSRRHRPSASQNKNRAPENVAASRPCRSSSSSMGSELDEADNEVKWFTDVAFRSLSSPELDYLDMYNSSHRSSTNISQPSTQESPAAISASWLAYADFRGSAPRLDNDELFQQTTSHYSDGLDPSRRHEMGSFECVDVAVEREDFRKVRRGVPKRQIQLKRKNANTEGKQDESSDNGSPVMPGILGSPLLESRSREKFTRQHSTPAAMQECYHSGESTEPIQQNERKSKLQKSISLDETGNKTKMATCLIKSVLSKKMQNVDKQSDEQTGDVVTPEFLPNSISTESAVTPPKETSNPDTCNTSSSHFTGDYRTTDETKPKKSFGGKASSRPSSSSSSKSVNFSQTDSEEADSQNRNVPSMRSEVRSELKVPFDNKKSRTEVQHADDHKLWDEGKGGDSANPTTQNPGATSDTGARQHIPNLECENTEGYKQLQQTGYTSKTQEAAFKAVEKKKTSLKVCLTPEAEPEPKASLSNTSFKDKEEWAEIRGDEKTEEEEEGNENNKSKGPIHKVRDVRRIVKNTYNLSFKGTTAMLCSEVNEEKTENFDAAKSLEIKKEVDEKKLNQEMWQEENKEEEMRVETKEEKKDVVRDLTSSPHPQSKSKSPSHSQPMQIEYKAVCWKEDKNRMSCSKKESENLSNKSQELGRVTQNPFNASIKAYTPQDTAYDKPGQRNLNMSAGTPEAVTDTGEKSAKTDRKPPMLASLPRVPSKEREVSTAVVIIRDGSTKTKSSSCLAQEEVATPFQAAGMSPSPGSNHPGGSPGSCGHSVSMLLKEKGYQADIGAVMGDNPVGRKGVPHKHINSLEIPLHIAGSVAARQIETHRERTFSSSSNLSGPSVVSDNTDSATKAREDEGIKPSARDSAKQTCASPLRNMQEQTPTAVKLKELGDFEAVKRMDPTFPPRSPAIRRFRPQPIEVKSLSTETQKEEIPSTIHNRPQTIEVKSIAKNSHKPVVPPKPTCKFKPGDLGVLSNEGQRPPATTMSVKPQDEERGQTIVVSSPTIYRKISNESVSTSNYTRKLAVSAVSSLKPPPSKTTSTTVSSVSKVSPAPPESETSISRGEQQQEAASPQSSRNPQRLPTSTTASTSHTDPRAKASLAPGSNTNSVPVSVPTVNQVPGPAPAPANQPNQSAVIDPDNQQQYTRAAYVQQEPVPVPSNSTKQPTAVSTTQAPGYTQQSSHRPPPGERSQRTDDLHFYTSDDPPSYDERESFSPLLLPDLPPRRTNRYQPSSQAPPCSCAAACPSHPGITPPHHRRSPHDHTPPAPTHSPGQALPCPLVQSLRPHQCRPDRQPMSFQRGSPKSSPHGPNHPSTLYQPLHQPPPCAPHSSLVAACPADRPLQPPQHIDPRRPAVHRSPQQQPPVMPGTHYSDPDHSHSPGLTPMDPQYLCGPPGLGPSYGSEYGADNSSLYSESSYGQTPRRVLMDPETGKYFYIEMPVQPLRKMLFDPETGQYVEVLIPQQAMSHSGLYPPAAAPYPSLQNPNLYASAPQYMPYAAPPPPPAHPHAQPQPPRYPEAPAAATMHASAGISYRNLSGQGSKTEPRNHPPLDQSYLESMYYVPTGMNASPNPTPPDYYHKRPPNLPPTGGKRS